MTAFTVHALDAATCPAFADLVERHNGVWGGCWCMGFHAEGTPRGRTAEENRAIKEGRVRDGRAHAALVFDGVECVGWCQFGSDAGGDSSREVTDERRGSAHGPGCPSTRRLPA